MGLKRRTVLTASLVGIIAAAFSEFALPPDMAGGYVWPVGRDPLPSPCQAFGAPRPDCSLGTSQPDYHRHVGADFAHGAGRAIGAITSGVVMATAYDQKCAGYNVRVNHGDFSAWYIHMQSGSTVSAGQTVVTGQTLGFIGNTGGCSQGAHLHLEITYAGALVDPVPFLQARVDGSFTPQFGDLNDMYIVSDPATGGGTYLVGPGGMIHILGPNHLTPLRALIEGGQRSFSLADLKVITGYVNALRTGTLIIPT
jgi:Peptidase family M23